MIEYTTVVADQANAGAADHQKMQVELDGILNAMARRGWELRTMTSVPTTGGARVLHTLVLSRTTG